MKKCKKEQQLGMHPSTAYGRLRKNLMFNMVQLLEMDWCFQCGAQIEAKEELSVEHMVPWQNSEDPLGLFFDMANITFSHKDCNSKAARKPKGKPCPSTTAYRKGCRCEGCRKAVRDYKKTLRKNTKLKKSS